MELVFNEISLKDNPDNKYQAISVLENFAETCSTLKREGFNKLRIESNFWNSLYFEDNDINTFLSQMSSRTKSSFLRSFIRKPFIADDFISEADENFAANYYSFNDIEITGLAYAFLLDTISVSLSTKAIWDNPEIEITEVSNDIRKNVIVKNASKPEHTDHHKNWIEEKKPIELIKSKISSNDKKISLRDDHGKDKLLHFSTKIVNSQYVDSVVNSLPFNPSENNFIRRVYPNGQIEIVLTDTDKGFGIIVQTTGRNIKETEAIGRILENDFG